MAGDARHATVTARSPIERSQAVGKGRVSAEPLDAARYSVPALEKGLEVLELLAATPTGMNVTAISGRLGRSTGELYRIIQYLEYRGYIDRDRESDLYTLSFRLFQLSHEHPPIRSLVVCAAPVMEQLAVQVGQSCHLSVVNRTDMVIVAQVDSPLPIRHSVRLGATFPIWETSSGVLLCAFSRPDELEAILNSVVEQVSPAVFEDFKMRLAEVQAQGFERRDSHLISGITNLSRPVFNHDGALAAALTIPYLEQRGNDVSLNEALEAVVTAAQDISSALGYNEGGR